MDEFVKAAAYWIDAFAEWAKDMWVKHLVDRMKELEKENEKLNGQVNALLFTVKMQEAMIRELREKKME